ncbi:MAG: aminotransferase class IV [Pseudomonadota bacterium]
MNNERIVYINGDFVPESRGHIHFRDRGFVYGDAVFDTSRTFNGRIFRLEDHVNRLFDSLRYLRIDPGLTAAEITTLTEDVLERNRHLLGPDDDYWVFQRITRGTNLPDGPGTGAGPTVIIECTPIPFAKRAPLFRDGAYLVVPSVRRTPPEAMSANAKTHNYLNFVVAANEIDTTNPHVWPVLLDTRGFLCEGNGSNLFLVKDGVVKTPKREFVLADISRQVVLELCDQLGLACVEADLTPFDASVADEIFITSTSLCLCPARRYNGHSIGDESPFPGPVTQRLIEAYAAEVDHDFVGQYLAHAA